MGSNALGAILIGLFSDLCLLNSVIARPQEELEEPTTVPPPYEVQDRVSTEAPSPFYTTGQFWIVFAVLAGIAAAVGVIVWKKRRSSPY